MKNKLQISIASVILSFFFFASVNAQSISDLAMLSVDKKVRENSKMILSNKPIKVSEIDNITSTKVFNADDEIYVAIILPLEFDKIAKKRGNGDLIFNLRESGSSEKKMINFIDYQDVNDPKSKIIRIHMTRKDSKLYRGWNVETRDMKPGEHKLNISVNFEKVSGGKECIINEVEIIYNK